MNLIKWRLNKETLSLSSPMIFSNLETRLPSNSMIKSKMPSTKLWWIEDLTQALRTSTINKRFNRTLAKENTWRERFLTIPRRSTCCSSKGTCIQSKFKQTEWTRVKRSTMLIKIDILTPQGKMWTSKKMRMVFIKVVVPQMTIKKNKKAVKVRWIKARLKGKLKKLLGWRIRMIKA